ncbi:MAG: hypothetical protein IJN34_08005 [Clostridia bacterium]|nr:hypothetical protein [Clostridia bacterium]
MRNQQQAKMNIPICLAGILLCLTLFSLHFTGGLYAKYTAKGSGGDDARVARFNITEDRSNFSETLKIETTPGKVEEKIIVTNSSEVAIAYTVTIKNRTQNIPYSFSVDNSAPSLDECSVTHYLEPNTSSAEIPIVAEWENNETATNYIGMVDLIDITIHAQQVD